MAARSFPTWIITQEPGMVPNRKGPFHDDRYVEELLRDAYRSNPEIICTVIDNPSEAAWSPQHGYEWLDMFGDRRRRHPRKDREADPAPQPKIEVSEDWQLVPRKASREMREAAMHYLLGTGNIYARDEETVVVETTTPGDVWKAMLGAAPASPQSTTGELFDGQNYDCPCAHPSQCDDSCMTPAPQPRALLLPGALTDKHANHSSLPAITGEDDQ